MSGFPVTDGVTTVMAPPPGVHPDFAHPSQNAWLQHYLVFGIGGPLAFLTMCQRFYTKMYLSQGLQVDDLFMFLGWAMSVVTQGLLVHSIVEGGMCAHAWEMPLSRFEAYSVITYITAPTYQLCNGFVKLSLLTFYLQLSPQKWFRVATWTSIVIVSLYTIILTLLMFFHCSPIRKAFDFTIAGGTCMDAGILYMATAVSNIITDVMLFILPIPMVVGLKMRGAQKIGAMVVFGIGSLTIATSVVRLVYLPATLRATDISWDAAPADVWTFIEGNLFIICGSMPTMRRFFRHVMPSVFGSESSSKQYPHRYGSRSSGNFASHSRSRRQYSKYSQFPEENEMQIFGEGAAGSKSAMASTTVDVSHEEEDAHSENAILQTKTFTVQYN